MRYQLARHWSVTSDADGNVHVTRPGMTGKIQSHNVGSEYSPFAVAVWLKLRMDRQPCKLVQEEFPEMSASDREFLLTGITPSEWNETFKGEDD